MPHSQIPTGNNSKKQRVTAPRLLAWGRLQNSRFIIIIIFCLLKIDLVWCKSSVRASGAPHTPPERIFSVTSQLQTFCLNVRAYLNNQKYGLICSLGLGKQATFRDANISVIPANDSWGTSTKIPYSWRITIDYPDLAVHLIGRAAREICFNESDALPKSGKWRIINMPEFLRFSSSDFIRRETSGQWGREMSTAFSC